MQMISQELLFVSYIQKQYSQLKSAQFNSLYIFYGRVYHTYIQRNNVLYKHISFDSISRDVG